MTNVTNIGQIQKTFTEQQLRESLAFVLKASDPKNQKELTDLSRINEQHVFAALVHGQLKQLDSKQGNQFEQDFQSLLTEQSKANPGYHIFEAARLAMRKLRLAGEFTKDVSVQIRQFAVGRAQLDSKRDELSTKNVTGKTGDTALRAVKTAIKKFITNEIATRREMKLFRDLNIARRKE